MQNEIDSSNIIAVLVNNKTQARIKLSYKQIRTIALDLERAIPTLHTTYDLLSIDAFRCSFLHEIEMTSHDLTIKNSPVLQSRIQRLIPSKEITEMIIRFSIER